MEKFPTELDSQAVQALLKPIFHGGGIDGQVGLGFYNVLGYALYQVFGDVPVMMNQITPDHLHNALAQAPEEVQKFMDFTNREGDTLSKADTLPPWMIPFIQQAASYLLQKLFERFASQKAPVNVFGMKVTIAPKPETPEPNKVFTTKPADPANPNPKPIQQAGAPASQPGGPSNPVVNDPGVKGPPGSSTTAQAKP